MHGTNTAPHCSPAPMLSVVLPVNRDDGFLDDALQSICSQTWGDFELLLIANGCTDALWEKVLTWQNHDPRIHAHRLVLGGLAFALNYGISIARGSYIARMDGDDISEPQRFEKQMAFLLSHPEVDVIGSHVFIFAKPEDHRAHWSGLVTYPENHADMELSTCPFTHSAVIIKKSTLIAHGGYCFGFYGEDYELWLRLYHAGAIFHNLPEMLLQYRLHDQQLSMPVADKNNQTAEFAYLMLHHLRSGNRQLLGAAMLRMKSKELWLFIGYAIVQITKLLLQKCLNLEPVKNIRAKLGKIRRKYRIFLPEQ